MIPKLNKYVGYVVHTNPEGQNGCEAVTMKIENEENCTVTFAHSTHSKWTKGNFFKITSAIFSLS